MGESKKKDYNSKLRLFCTHPNCKGLFNKYCNKMEHALNHKIVIFMLESEALRLGLKL